MRTSVPLALVAVAVLHVAASWPFPWQAESVSASLLRGNPDVVVLLALGTWVALHGRRRLAAALVGGGLLWASLYRFGLTLMAAVYSKEFDPYTDILDLPGLLHLLTENDSSALRVLIAVAFLLALGVVGLALSFLAQHALVLAHSRRRGFVALALFQGCVFVSWVDDASSDRGRSRWWAPSMLQQTVLDTHLALRAWRLQSEFAVRVAETTAELEQIDGHLAGLEGADVYLCFVESYGRALLRRRDTASQLQRWTEEFTPELGAAGYHVLSSFLFPSIAGGNSALAHAEFLSGVAVENKRAFGLMLEAPLKPLPRYFQAAGYRTVNVQPAMPIPWPEGLQFYGFDESLFQPDLPYAGPVYHWGRMPDQYALIQAWQKYVEPAEQPLFLQFVSVNSHSPFTMIPRYRSDWQSARDPAGWNDAPARQFDITWLNYMGHPDVEQAYLASIHYSLRTLVGFAAQLQRPSMLVILGDHQPPVAGELMTSDRSFDVPIHIVANREELLVPFLAAGFVPGWFPAADAASVPSRRFLPSFLRLFSPPPVAPAAAAGE